MVGQGRDSLDKQPPAKRKLPTGNGQQRQRSMTDPRPLMSLPVCQGPPPPFQPRPTNRIITQPVHPSQSSLAAHGGTVISPVAQATATVPRPVQQATEPVRTAAQQSSKRPSAVPKGVLSTSSRLGDAEWRSRSESLGGQLAHMQEKNLLTDCTVRVGQDNTLFRCHKLVLAAASPIWQGMLFESNGGEERSKDINLPNIQADVFEKIIKFIYRGEVELLTCEQALDLCEAGYPLSLMSLVKRCTDFLCSNLQPESTLRAYRFAEQQMIRKNAVFGVLLNKSLQMIREHASTLLASAEFEEMSPDAVMTILKEEHLNVTSELDIVNALARWERSGAGATNKRITDKMKLHVRFLSLTGQQFAMAYNLTTFLTENERLNILYNINAPGHSEPFLEGLCSETQPRLRALVPKPTQPTPLFRTTMTKNPLYFITNTGHGPCGCSITLTVTDTLLLYGVELHTQQKAEDYEPPRKRGALSPTDGYSEHVKFLVLEIVGNTAKVIKTVNHNHDVKYDNKMRVMLTEPVSLRPLPRGYYCLQVLLCQSGGRYPVREPESPTAKHGRVELKFDIAVDVPFYCWGNSGIVHSLLLEPPRAPRANLRKSAPSKNQGQPPKPTILAAAVV